MPDWTNPANGNWTDPARWTGGVPNAAGATANFIVPNPGNATVLINFSQNAAIRVGTLNIVTDSDQAWAFQGDAGVTSATLLFQGVGGGPAFLNADTNNSTRQSKIANFNGLTVTLASDLIVTTADSDTYFEISAPITGAFDVYKFGSGTFRVSGGNSNMAGDYYLNGGRTELTSANGVGGVSVIKLNNGATLAGVNAFTLAANMETGSGNAAGVIVAKTGTTLTLAGDLLLHGSGAAAITFGSAADAGTIVLSGTCSIAGAGGFNLAGGTLRFGSTTAGANYFAALGPNAAVQVKTGAILDTGGFAATIDNLDLDGGTLQSTNGPLDLTSDQRIGNVLEGTVVGTVQADRLFFNLSGNIDLSGLTFNNWTDGTDTITINGDGSSNEIVSSGRNETINGGGGADLLDGRGGIDTISGGTGDDSYFIADALSTLIENAGEGTDTVVSSNGGPTAFTLAANFENLTFVGPAQHTGIGNTAGNVLTGGSGNDELQGREGNDTLLGNGSADTLDGGTGNDNLIGGAGDDVYVVDSAGDLVTEAAGGGDDRVMSSVSWTLGANSHVDRITTIDNLATTAINLTGNELANVIFGNEGANTLSGAALNDALIGNGGNDVLIGGTGIDTTNGGAGNDYHYVDDFADVVIEAAGEGNDRVFASVTYKLAAGAEVEMLTTDANAGTAAINLTGNAGVQGIFGNAGANQLTGGGGADSLSGFEGDDWYFITDGHEHVFESAGQGNDRVFASVSYALAAGVSVEKLTTDFNAGTTAINLTGNELANTIYGNEGANVLNGGAGNDSLIGNGGSDSFAFTTALGANNVDTIIDFASGTDKIALDDAVFTAIGVPGALNPNAFFAGTAAHDADDRIIYDQGSGNLYYDADGNGAGAAILFANLHGQPAIAASDFSVI